jgi:hypothetical protein
MWRHGIPILFRLTDTRKSTKENNVFKAGVIGQLIIHKKEGSQQDLYAYNNFPLPSKNLLHFDMLKI